MRITDKALVLHTTRYGDRKYLLTLFTENNGLMTVAAIAGKQGAKVRTSSLLPMSFIEAEIDSRQNRDIQTLTESRVFLAPDLSGSINKLSIAQFLNEVLIKTLREQGSHPDIFELLLQVVTVLEGSEKLYLDVHLYALSELAKLLGFGPQNDRAHGGPYFDCREGCFGNIALPFPLGLDTADSLLFSDFLESDLTDYQLNNEKRRRLLDIFIAYYQLHVPGFGELKSLDVFRTLFS